MSISGFYSIIQIFKPGLTVTLSSTTAVGATSFTLSSASGIVSGDLIVIDTDSESDYLTVASVSSNVITTTTAAKYAHLSGVNVFRPGALTKTSGTPNLLLDTEIDANTGTSRGAYQVAWKELQQGGLDQATFFLHKSYEDYADIQFGNWILFGLQGGTLSANVSSGAASITVDNLINNTNLSTNLNLLNIQANDPIVISDGVNTEIFIASSVTGSGPWTINLSVAPGGTSTLLNSYSASSGAKVCRLVYQGIIQSRGRTTDRKNQFQIVASGMFGRYGQVCGNSNASQVDGATLMSDVLNSYTQTLPEIIVNSSNLATSSIPVTVTEQDARVSQIMADILKQEGSMVASQSNNGLTVTPTALSFPQGSTAAQYARVNGGTSPYTASTSNSAVATVSLVGSDAVNTTTVKNTVQSGSLSIVVNTTTKTIGTTGTTSNTGSLATGDLILIDGGTAQAEFATIASVNSGTSTLTLSQGLTYTHSAGATVVQYLSVKVTPGSTAGTATITITDAGSLSVSIAVSVAVAPQSTSASVYSVWVDALRQVHHQITPTYGTATKSIDITNATNTNGDWVYTMDTSDMDGAALMNAAIVRGGSDSGGNRIRILVREKHSRKILNAWYEGTLDNTDITDEQQLANWAASQLATLAYPMTSATLTLSSSSMRITTQDLLQITGFSDGSTMVANPLEIDYVADAQKGLVSAALTLGVLRPNIDAIALEYANERSIRETYNQPPANLTNGVVTGFLFTQGSGLNFTIASGTIYYNGVQYNVPAYSGSATVNATSYWGVQVAGGTATIVQMPSAQAASQINGFNIYEIRYRGGNPEAASSFSGIALYKITTNATAITGHAAIYTTAGVGPGNIPPVTSGTVTVSGVSLGAYTGQAGTTGVDVTCTVNYTGLLESVGQYRIVAVPHGLATSSQWLWSSSGTWGEGILKASQITSNTQTVTIAVANMPLGIQLDLYFFADDLTGSTGQWPSNNPILTTTAQQLSINSMPKMPAGAAFTASSVSIFAADSGMVRTAYRASDALINPILHAIFTLNESTSPDTSQWAYSGNLYIRPYSAVQNQTDKTTYEAHNQGSLPGYFTNGKACNFYAKPVTAGQRYDVAATLTDGQGGETSLVYLGNYTVPKAQNGNPIGPIWGIGHFLGDTSGDITTTIVDGGNRRFLHPVMSAGVQGTINQTADSFGAYTKYGAMHRLHLEQSGQPGGTNLLYNPTFANGTTGWTRMSSGLTWTTDAYGGGRLNTTSGTLGSGSYDGWYQSVTMPFSGQSLVCSGILEVLSAVANVAYKIDVTDPTQNTSLGSFSWVSGGSSRQPFAFSLNNAANGSVIVRLYALNLTGGSSSVGTMTVQKLQLEYGTQPSPWVDHNSTKLVTITHDSSGNLDLSRGQSGKLVPYANTSTEYQGNFDSSGVAKHTTFMNTHGLNLNNVQGIPAYSYTSTTTSITITIPASTFTRADGSTVNVPQFQQTWGSLSASTAYNWDLYYDAPSNTFGAAYYTTSVPTANQKFVDCYADGRIAIYAALQLTTPSSGSGGGSGGGGTGGGGSSCPADFQPIETLERGLVRADELNIGEHIRNGEEWVAITDLIRRPAPIWKYAVDAGETEVFFVNSTHAVKQNGHWVAIEDVRSGSFIEGRSGELFRVSACEYVRDGHYIAMEVEGHEYTLGNAACHNPTTF